jgi:hypothetical protein
MTTIVDGSTGVSVVGTTGFTSQTNGLGTGLVPAEQFYSLNSTLAGANATGAQSVLGVGVTLVGSTVYQLEAVYAFSKTAGSVSHTFGIGFGGTATVNNIAYSFQGLFKSTGFTGVTPPDVMEYIQTTSNTTVTVATTGTSIQLIGILKGTVSVNAGGTFIPQYSLSAAPGGAYTTAVGTYFKISPLAASGSNVNIGTWA